MNTNLYSRLNNCPEWRIYKNSNTAYGNKSTKYFSLGFRINSSSIYCFGGTRECRSCYFSLGNICTIESNTAYLMNSIKQLADDDDYISVTPKSYPEFFI